MGACVPPTSAGRSMQEQRVESGNRARQKIGCMAARAHLLDNAHTMLLRAKRIDVLGHLGDNECGVRVLEGDTDAPRAVRVERTLEHVSIELIDERATLGRWKLRDSRLHHARTLRVLEELDYVTAQSGVDGVVGLCTRGKLGDDIVAKGMGCKLEQVWCQFIAGALELRSHAPLGRGERRACALPLKSACSCAGCSKARPELASGPSRLECQQERRRAGHACWWSGCCWGWLFGESVLLGAPLSGPTQAAGEPPPTPWRTLARQGEPSWA
eukprot:scaffold72612_cov32-Tisochrysis_lutea.AAC.2